MALDTTLAQSVTISGTSAQSGALTPGQWIVASTTNCWVAIGANPTAAPHTAGSTFVPTAFPLIFNIPVNGWKIAIIQDAAGGFASVTPNV